MEAEGGEGINRGEMEKKKERERAKNINQSWSLGDLSHKTQSNTRAQCETGETRGTASITWVSLSNTLWRLDPGLPVVEPLWDCAAATQPSLNLAVK